MNKENPKIDADQVISACYACEAVPDKSCTECGKLFCSNHGGKRLLLKPDDGKISLKKKMICDDCTPNQTMMNIIKYIMILIVVIMVITVIAVMVYQFFIKDDSIPSRPEPAAPAPVESVEPVE